MQRPGLGRDAAAALRPLRRRPKTLDAAPVLIDATGSGAGAALSGNRDRDRSPAPSTRDHRGSARPGVSDEPAALVDAEGLGQEGDSDSNREVLRRSRMIAARLAVPRPRCHRSSRRVGGELVSRRYDGRSDEIDIDATVDALVERRVLEAEDIVVRERQRLRRDVVLAVDVSGSMRGERIRTAAATVGALAAELSRDRLAVIAFWSDAAVIATMDRPVPATQVLDTLLRLPARGLTNLSFPLETALAELSRGSSTDGRVVLLSDCVHNAGPDPRLAGARLPRLDVLLDASGQVDEELARDLARLGRGRLATIRDYRQAAPALSAILTP